MIHSRQSPRPRSWSISLQSRWVLLHQPQLLLLLLLLLLLYLLLLLPGARVPGELVEERYRLPLQVGGSQPSRLVLLNLLLWAWGGRRHVSITRVGSQLPGCPRRLILPLDHSAQLEELSTSRRTRHSLRSSPLTLPQLRRWDQHLSLSLILLLPLHSGGRGVAEGSMQRRWNSGCFSAWASPPLMTS